MPPERNGPRVMLKSITEPPGIPARDNWDSIDLGIGVPTKIAVEIAH